MDALSGASVRGAINSLNETWSDCKKVLWNSRSILYLICLVSIVVFVSMILSWNKNFVVFLTGLLTALSVFGALIVSKQSCFGIFDNIVSDAVTGGIR